jgi:hypothetical protein
VARETAMTVTDNQVATLRAYLAGDFDRYEQLNERLDRNADGPGYGTLITAAFFEAAERRFAQSNGTAEVIEFVSSVRAKSNDLGERIDARTAERIIRAVYTDEDIDDIDGATLIRTQFLLLAALVAEARLDDAGLDEFMAAAQRLANQ